MLVRNWMTRDPQTVSPDETLRAAFDKMALGRFRRLPVMEGGSLVGILTERDITRYEGKVCYTAVRAAMTRAPRTISPLATVELAAELMIERKIGGLPVLHEWDLVGVITTTDVMRAFLQLTGATEEESVRVDLAADGYRGLGQACATVTEAGGEVLAAGVYREPVQGTPVVDSDTHDTFEPELVMQRLPCRRPRAGPLHS